MAVKYWMISDRNVKRNGLGPHSAPLSFWTSDGKRDLTKIKSWKQRDSAKDFKRMLLERADSFPFIEDAELHEKQLHVTLYVHGFNNSWEDAVRTYRSLCKSLFSGNNSLGICILFTWPSDGMATNYLPDRKDAREAAPDLADVLSGFYDWLLKMQEKGAADPTKACRAKTSVISHSMGNYVLQHAMQLAWTRKNQPLLVSLINQLVMVAADVDNDLFSGGEVIDRGDGDAIANLTYRVTSLYTGRDSVLGMSAGLKHFGKRRLGRSGLDRNEPLPDNVWDIDCSKLFKANQRNIHSAYFAEPKTIRLMRKILKGLDRNLITGNGG